MKLFRYNQIGQELLGKRMICLVNKADPNTPDDAATAKQTPSYTPESGDSELQQVATRLKVDDILSSTGDNQSSVQIANRIKEIHDLRQEGKIPELNRKIMGWYGNHPTYSTYIAGAGGTVNPGIINQIRTAELARMRTQLQAEAQLEMDDIMQNQVPPNFAFALNHLTVGGVANQLSTETQALLGEININAPNSATEFLRLTHEREQLQNRLDISKAELERAKGGLEAHNTQKTIFKDRTDMWHKKIKRWTKMLAIGSLPVGLVGGIGAAIKSATAIGVAGGALGPLGAALGVGLLGKGAQKAVDFGKYAIHAVSGWWNHKWDIDAREESTVVRDQRRDLLNATAQLEGYRKENSGKLAVLQRQYNDYNQAKIDATTEAERDQLDQRMQSLASVMTLYRISEGNYAKRITAPGPITNDFIVEQLHAMGVRGVDDNTDQETELVALAQKDDQNHIIAHQTTLQSIGLGDDIMKEIHTLDNAEVNRLRNFLNNPNLPVAPVLAADFRRKAVRMVAVVDALHALPDNNAWRDSFRLAILKELDGQVGDIARVSAMSILKTMEDSKDSDIKNTAVRLKRDPMILWNYGGITALVNRPRHGEDFEKWTGRLSPTTMQQVLTALEAVKSYSIDRTGRLVDRLTPIRTSVEDAFSAITDPDLIIQLNDDPKSVMTAAAEEYLGSKGKSFSFPESTGLSFLDLIGQYEDAKELNEIRSLLQKLQSERAFVRDGEVHFLSEDLKQIDENLGKIEDKNIVQLIKAQPDALRAVDGALPEAATLTPAARNFNEYKRRLTPDDRQILANALLDIQNPATKYVLTADNQGLEREMSTTVKDLVKMMEEMNEKNPDIAFCISNTPQALLDYANNNNILTPEEENGPQDTQSFEAWVRGLNDPSNLRRVKNLLNQVKNFKVVNNVIVNPLQPVHEEIETEFSLAFIDDGIKTLLENDPHSILKKAADFKLSQKNRKYTIPEDANDFVDGVRRVTSISELREIRDMLKFLREEAFIRNNQPHFLKEDFDNIEKEINKIKNDGVKALIKTRPDCLAIIDRQLPSTADKGTNTFDDYVRSLDQEDRIRVLEAIKKTQSPHKYVLNDLDNTELVPEYLDNIRTLFRGFSDIIRNRLDGDRADLIRDLESISSLVGYKYSGNFNFVPDEQVVVNGANEDPEFLDRMSQLVREPEHLKVILNVLEQMNKRTVELQNGDWTRRR